MGGSSGGGPSRRDLSKLVELAKKTLRETGQESKCNVFISFAYEDLREVNLLRGQAKNENSELEFNDWSLREPFDSKRAEYIKQGIRDRIKQSSVMLVYLSNKTVQSKWVDWEIRESIKLGKGVLAVYKGVVPPKTVPSAITEYKIKSIKWTQSGLADAIQKARRSD